MNELDFYNIKAAMVELAQVGAVLIRTARMVQAKIDDQDGGGA